MQEELILTSKDLNLLDRLFLNQLVLLKIIFNNNEELYKIFSSKVGDLNIVLLLKELEDRQYIKIMSTDYSDLSSFAVRVKTEELFKQEVDNVTEVLQYLNLKLGKTRGFSTKSGSNRRFITARFAEGYSVDDLKSVIDLKVKEWKGTTMEEYLRPETLFNSTKFAGYIVRTESSNNTKNRTTAL